MGRSAQKRKNKRSKQQFADYDDNVVTADFGREDVIRVQPKDLTPKNKEQRQYINTIRNTTVTVGIGAPGSGKTFIPSVLAAQELMNPNSPFENIVLIRPNEPLGKSLGMLPGDLFEKLEPWLEPIAAGIRWSIGDQAYKGLVNRQKIKLLAVEHTRGRTFNNSYVIVDEAQNLSVEAVKCIVTRVGMDCRMIICGDIAQKDIHGNSGLALLMEIYNKYEYCPFSMVELFEDVRSKESAAFCAIFKDMGIM